MTFSISDLSVVIPTLNEEGVIVHTISSLYNRTGDGPGVIIVVDGGSIDRTIEIAKNAGATVLQTKRGRGRQLAEGGNLASGSWLLFLHADTQLQNGWHDSIVSFISRTSLTKQNVAAFRFKLDDDSFAARFLECLVAIRSGFFHLPWGDQGLLISASHYRAIGGYKNLFVMEDVEIIQRIGFSHVRIIGVDAVTSAKKYKKYGYIRKSLHNLFCLFCFYFGMSTVWLDRQYNNKYK